MYFCPLCANLLLVKPGEYGNELFCQSCPYVSKITKPLSKRQQFARKAVDDVLGGAGSWENVDQTDASCPKCEHNRAFFMQIQIRSADEPMSIFYKCVKCSNQWREG
ncbi:RNA polymerase III C11 subunit [Polyrhizophydium stewartii]|uniref:DNA-directed RNA polymerase subunit n=1 Tax=Polyrhizophydium stewartii TaxID=2732419 RepID=A0ABR4NEG5_9FUNG|nr:DNA-directed RNA polymerase III subunit RPC10 [Polyrhizophydium stewartii]